MSYSYLHPAVVARESAGRGRGVFATRPIPRDTVVAMWGGRVITRTEAAALSPELQHYFLRIDRELVIGPPAEGPLHDSELVNHSCEPTCGLRGQVALVAMRDIAPDEEITFDYAMSEVEDQPFECRCGAASCRGRVQAADSTATELRSRYAGYFSYWVEHYVHAPEVEQ